MALAVRVGHVTGLDVRGERLGGQGEVDTQAVVACVVAVTLVPAGEAAVVGVQRAVDIHELALVQDLAQLGALGLPDR